MIQFANPLSLDVKFFTLPKYEDHRGHFSETFNQRNIQIHLGIRDLFVQDNESYSAKRGTLRGIHFQNRPMDQAKIVRCTRGIIADYVVDLRKDSKTYKQWTSFVLSKDNEYLLVPRGFGHAFITLTDDVTVQYKVSQYYDKEHDRSIRWNDPAIAINWPFKSPILSEKDKNAPLLKDCDCNL